MNTFLCCHYGCHEYLTQCLYFFYWISNKKEKQNKKNTKYQAKASFKQPLFHDSDIYSSRSVVANWSIMAIWLVNFNPAMSPLRTEEVPGQGKKDGLHELESRCYSVSSMRQGTAKPLDAAVLKLGWDSLEGWGEGRHVLQSMCLLAKRAARVDSDWNDRWALECWLFWQVLSSRLAVL